MSRSRLFKTLEIPPGHIVRTVELIFKSAAAAVSLTFDFCTGRFPPLPLRRDKNGLWRIQLMLTPGRYRYQFIVNGRWLNDPASCAFRLGNSRRNNCAARVAEDIPS